MFIQRECPLIYILIFSAFFSAIGCNQQKVESPGGYNMGQPEITEFGKALEEISGINYVGETGNLVAISDNKRNVFEIILKTSKLSDYTDKVVPSESDLEDIVKVGNSIYVLASKGIIYEIVDGTKDTTGVVSYNLELEGPNDFETLYYDSSANGLVLLCKSCAFDKGQKKRSAFLFSLSTKSFDTTQMYTINTGDVKSTLKMEDAKFDPSAAAIHPINNNLYILSSAGNLLVITDRKGKVLEGLRLNPDQFPQAEGIAFAPDGTMFISNEGKYGTATLIKFPYNKPSKKK